ncbi:MAG: DUF3568 family protein [Thermodesulfobacteriota bacterium]
MKSIFRPVFWLCILSLMCIGCRSMLIEQKPADKRAVTVSYLEGDLITTYQAPLALTLKAAAEALSAHKEPEIDVLEVSAEEGAGKIDAKTRNGIPVTIWLESTEAVATRIRIRVGIGDRITSMSIQEAIGDRLPVLRNS